MNGSSRSSLQAEGGYSNSSQVIDSNDTDITPDFEKENLDEHFELGNTIDKGRHSEMVKAVPKGYSTDQTKPYAIKKIRRWGLQWNRKSALLREVGILRKLSHPNVVKIYHFFPHEPKCYYTVLEHLEGGELLDHVARKKESKEPYNEATVQKLCLTIIDVIKHVHDEGIVHRDINPGSFVLAKPEDESSIRLTGFGEACSFREEPVTTQIRLYADRFVAPEILAKKPYGASEDMWNIGRVVYILLTGRDLIFRRGIIVKKKENMEKRMEQNWENTSDEGKDFVRKLLKKDPAKRMTAKEAATHMWTRTGGGILASNDLMGNIDKFRLCNIKRKLKAAIDLFLFADQFCGPLMSTVPKDSKFLHAYEVQEELGKGAFACVHKVRLKEGGAELEAERAKINGSRGEKAQSEEEEFAAKKIKRKGLNKKCERRVFDEVCILGKLNHGNVIKLHEFYSDDPENYYIVLELMRGGELLHQIVKERKFDEQEVRDICWVLFEAVKYIHSEGIVHHDLKPENILLASEHDTKSIRLADFGFACDVTKQPAEGCCGTLGYVAPEIINHERHGKPVDMWSMGVVIFNMLFGGHFPEEYPRFHSRAMPGRAKFDPQWWDHVSHDAKDLIGRLLTVDPSERLTARGALEHPWFKKEGKTLASNNLTFSLKQLKMFNARRKFRGAINTLLATKKIREEQQRERDQPEDLRQRMTRQAHVRTIHHVQNE